MIESALPLYPPGAESTINDLSCGIFNMFLGLGQIVAPIFGATLTKAYGFQICCDLVSIVCLVFAILYYICAEGRSAIKDSKWGDIEEEIEEAMNYDGQSIKRS